MKTEIIKSLSVTGFMMGILLQVSVNAQDVMDYDGNVYKTVSYGSQVWTAGNLNVMHFRNGDVIPQAKTEEEWTLAGKSGSPAWCYYENDSVNGSTYGKLYNWYAINDPRGLAPDGWHIPTSADWMTLIKHLMGVDIAGTKLKSKSGWKSRKGTDQIGFAGIPAGYREPDGKFKNMGKACQWWSNSVPVSVNPSNLIYSIMLDDNTIEVKYLKAEKTSGFSVRCKKD